MAVSLKLGAGHPSRLGTRGRVWDPAGCPHDGAVQGQNSGSLEKLSRDGRLENSSSSRAEWERLTCSKLSVSPRRGRGRLAYPRMQSRRAGKHRRSGGAGCFMEIGCYKGEKLSIRVPRCQPRLQRDIRLHPIPPRARDTNFHTPMAPKRQRAPTSPIERANRQTDKEFIANYLQPSVTSSTLHPSSPAQLPPKPWTTEWSHPKTGTKYTISLVQSGKLSEEELKACFDLIKETSYDDYQNSKDKWQPRKKMEEMRSPDLRYVLVKDGSSGSIRAFTSLMPTYEEGQPVVYCYEIHLKPELQG
ncbi:hypothetical protein NEUTE2DRAFT_76150 [Neurospora tetrasperma FGSC 2509]|nr:hypothetical protein NEUTE2DRAFT_76150 [Neurospora tetrasperma FGSC 2509]